MIPFTTYLGLISKCGFGEYWTQVGATAKQKAIICPIISVHLILKSTGKKHNKPPDKYTVKKFQNNDMPHYMVLHSWERQLILKTPN